MNFLDDPERTHEQFNIWFWGFVGIIILSIWPNWILWAAMIVPNVARVLVQEIWVERRGKVDTSNHDFFYDTIMRPVATAIIWTIVMVPTKFIALPIITSFVIGYKYSWFHKGE